MTLEQALELPFEDYLKWCRNFPSHDHSFMLLDIQNIPGGTVFLEALWARRYWMMYRPPKPEPSVLKLALEQIACDSGYLGSVAKDALRQAYPLTPDEEVDALPLSDLDLPARVRNALIREGLYNVGRLRAYSEERLLRVPHFGPNGLRLVKEVLAKYGRRLAL